MGRGSYGFVQLVIEPSSGRVFALKAYSKQQVVEGNQQSHVIGERRTLRILNHPFLVRLYQTYRDEHRLYFLTDACLGGDLFSLLRRSVCFPEDSVRFFGGQVVLAVEYMHAKGVAHRDIKPENLLLDAQGYVKLSDFGFAKILGEDGSTQTLCGTPDYMAPEVLAGGGHGKGVDWWALGVLLYELIVSFPPFADADHLRSCQRILGGDLSFPSHVSPLAASLIRQLLQVKPSRRLGVVDGGAKLVKIHPFFTGTAGFDWLALYSRTMAPPYPPRLDSNTDLRHFAHYKLQNVGAVRPYVDDGSNWDADF